MLFDLPGYLSMNEEVQRSTGGRVDMQFAAESGYVHVKFVGLAVLVMGVVGEWR